VAEPEIEVEPDSAKPLSPSDTAWINFGTQTIVNSISSIEDFSKSMIGWDSGLFTAYFVLLKFLSIASLSLVAPSPTSQGSSASTVNPIFGLQATQGVANYYYFIPALLLVLSIACFVFAYVPHRGELVLISQKSIVDFRQAAFNRKYWFMIAGTIILGASLLVMMYLFLSILLYQPPSA